MNYLTSCFLFISKVQFVGRKKGHFFKGSGKMGNAQSPSSRHNEAQFEPTWSQTLAKPRAWIPQQGMAEDRFGPYSPPGRGAVSPKSIVDRRFDNDCMQKDPRLARYNRFVVRNLCRLQCEFLLYCVS